MAAIIYPKSDDDSYERGFKAGYEACHAERAAAPQVEVQTAKPAAWGRIINGEAITVSRIKTGANDEPLYAGPQPAPVAQASMQSQLEEAGKAAIEIRNELDRVRADRNYHADLAESWKAQFHSAAAAASEYSEFWEQHHGEFDSFGNYIPYSQMDGDLRAAQRRIAELEASSVPSADCGSGK